MQIIQFDNFSRFIPRDHLKLKIVRGIVEFDALRKWRLSQQYSSMPINWWWTILAASWNRSRLDPVGCDCAAMNLHTVTLWTFRLHLYVSIFARAFDAVISCWFCWTSGQVECHVIFLHLAREFVDDIRFDDALIAAVVVGILTYKHTFSLMHSAIRIVQIAS